MLHIVKVMLYSDCTSRHNSSIQSTKFLQISILKLDFQRCFPHNATQEFANHSTARARFKAARETERRRKFDRRNAKLR